jgi:hypothetical protein
MRLHLTLAFCYLTAWAQMGGAQIVTSDQENRPFSFEEVGIAPNAVSVPEGFILLVRRSSEYCAIKFTKFWTGKTKEDEYATYESYYQDDAAGDFTKENVKFREGELSRPRLRGIGRLSFSFGNTDIQCGSIKLFWSGRSWVYFFSSNQNQGDYGIELAPTKWTHISQVNVFDQRLQWYKYDPERQRIKIPIGRLWQ